MLFFPFPVNFSATRRCHCPLLTARDTRAPSLLQRGLPRAQHPPSPTSLLSRTSKVLQTHRLSSEAGEGIHSQLGWGWGGHRLLQAHLPEAEKNQMQLSLVPEPNASQSLSLLICKMRTPAHFLKSPPALNKFSFCQGYTRKKLSYIFKQKFLERRGGKKNKTPFRGAGTERIHPQRFQAASSRRTGPTWRSPAGLPVAGH